MDLWMLQGSSSDSLPPLVGVAAVVAMCALVKRVVGGGSPGPRVLATSLSTLGFWLALSSSGGANTRVTDRPFRSGDAPVPPWSPAEGPPPLPAAGVKDQWQEAEGRFVLSGSGRSGSPWAKELHPAIHGGEGKPAGPLFPRVGADLRSCREDDEILGCMARHPAGKGLTPPTPHIDRAPAVTQGSGSLSTQDDSELAGQGAAPARYVVERGDSLWSIAERFLGTESAAEIARYWPSIHRWNRDVIGKDPNFLLPGQVLQLPPVPVKS